MRLRLLKVQRMRREVAFCVFLPALTLLSKRTSCCKCCVSCGDGLHVSSHAIRCHSCCEAQQLAAMSPFLEAQCEHDVCDSIWMLLSI